MTNSTLRPEAQDLLEMLATHRGFLRYTVRGLTDEQLAQRTTVSELCLGGLIKHVTAAEESWANFIVEGTSSIGGFDEATLAAHHEQFQVRRGDTLTSLLDAYETVARATDELVARLPDFDAGHPLPVAPWFEPGARWTARRALLHIIAETAQHAGHADIIREALDGQQTMG
jgi:uncharacterized damage-inducible protein DinB